MNSGTNNALVKQLAGMSQLVDKMNAEGVCNSACQKRKKLERLKNDYMKAKNKLHNAQPEFDLAEKLYITEKNGASYYQSNIQEAKFKQEAEAEVKGWDEIVLPILDKLESQIGYYKTQYIYKSNVEYLYDSYNKDLNQLYDNIEKTRGKNNVNDRLAQFYNDRSESIKTVIKYLKYVYWALFIIIIGVLIYKKLYNDFTYYPYILILAVAPFTLSWFYVFIMSRFRYFVIDNIYLIFLTTVIAVFFLFNIVSNIPFKHQAE
jgi:cellulose synthase/poly-beta-1,6-N-acetylglucosamine synthase-like glycosyltransferase